MNYSGMSWKTFNFIIAPEELREVLQPYHMVIDNTHVLLDYTESSIEEYVDMYRELFGLLSSGEQLIWKQHWHLTEHRAVTSDLSKCIYGRIHEYEGQQYKSPIFNEPLVNLQPYTFSVYKDSKDKLAVSTRFSYEQNPENIVGVEINYPSKIIRKSEDEWVDTRGLNVFADFENIKKSIMEITKPLTIIKDGEVKRTGVRVSAEAKKYVGNFYAFKSNDIKIK